MTTAHSMLNVILRRAAPIAATLSCLAGVACTPPAKQLSEPTILLAPYADDAILWAVVPLANESGVSVVDQLAITDALVNQIEQVDGVIAIPTNRTLEAMAALQLSSIRSTSDAKALARALGADAIVIGTVTAWYPYSPPRLGMTLSLFARTPSMLAANYSSIDPRALQKAPTDQTQVSSGFSQKPVAIVSAYFDASNHEVRQDVLEYARGRHNPAYAMGEERFTRSMERYTEFVCFRMVESLIEREAGRVAHAEASKR